MILFSAVPTLSMQRFTSFNPAQAGGSDSRRRLAPAPRALAAAALAAATLLAGCATAPEPAAGQPQAAAAPAPGMTAPLITVPPTSVGRWVDLGHVQAPWLAGDAPVPVSGPTAPTRVAGLRRDDGRWLAIAVVQTAPAGAAPCPLARSHEMLNDGADHCLRLRRDADFDRWLERQHSVLYQWIEGRGWGAKPRGWVAYRVPPNGGPALEAHVLFDTTLLEPATRNPTDFLNAGAPGNAWARQLAAATRNAAGTGRLALPPFPFGPRVAAAPPAPAVAPPPAQATQVTPPARPPVQAPRHDRE